jgi:hypothetical protein
MDEMTQVFEKYVFFSARREVETLNAVLDILLTLQVASLTVDYTDRPNQEFACFNERSKKIIASLPDPQRIDRIAGEFADGGCFELRGGAFAIAVSSDQYNYEVIDSLRRLLSSILPLCVFRNPYIWGVDMYLPYQREDFFEARKRTARSQKLEDPEVDIFRRDDGVIIKLRFHLREEYAAYEMDSAFKLIHEVFADFLEALKRGGHEGLEVLFQYCTDLPAFRRFEPRTKIGHKIKSLLNQR